MSSPHFLNITQTILHSRLCKCYCSLNQLTFYTTSDFPNKQTYSSEITHSFLKLITLSNNLIIYITALEKETNHTHLIEKWIIYGNPSQINNFNLLNKLIKVSLTSIIPTHSTFKKYQFDRNLLFSYKLSTSDNYYFTANNLSKHIIYSHPNLSIICLSNTSFTYHKKLNLTIIEDYNGFKHNNSVIVPKSTFNVNNQSSPIEIIIKKSNSYTKCYSISPPHFSSYDNAFPNSSEFDMDPPLQSFFDSCNKNLILYTESLPLSHYFNEFHNLSSHYIFM